MLMKFYKMMGGLRDTCSGAIVNGWIIRNYLNEVREILISLYLCVCD
jgi:hypothetical protein